MTSVAVKEAGGGGALGGKGSRRVVRWAVENLMPSAERFILIHVIPTIISIPTPCAHLLCYLGESHMTTGPFHWELVQRAKVLCYYPVGVIFIKKFANAAPFYRFYKIGTIGDGKGDPFRACLFGQNQGRIGIEWNKISMAEIFIPYT